MIKYLAPLIYNNQIQVSMNDININTASITLGNGCFWCTEAVFQLLEGVISVTSGYSGGETINPDYKSVCSGLTGHAECLQILFDPAKISFEDLLDIFWKTHDPTTLNRQGNDVGTQYRSVIFYKTNENSVYNTRLVITTFLHFFLSKVSPKRNRDSLLAFSLNHF